MVQDPNQYYQNENVAESYDQMRFSSLAGKVFETLERYNIRKAFRALDLDRDATIIDAPCGTGRLAEALLEEGYRVVGMDISEEMLAQAQHRLARFGNRFTTRKVDMMNPDLPPDTRYDAALCARVLMHFPLEQQIEFLRNVSHIVEGRVVFTQSWVSRYQNMRRGVKRLLRHQTAVNYPISRVQLAQLLKGAGLRELRRLRPCPPVTEEVIVVTQPG